MRTLTSAEASFISGGTAAPNNGNSGSQQCFSNGKANPSVTVCQNGNIQTVITCTTTGGGLSLNGTNKVGTVGGSLNGNYTTCTKTTTDLSTGKTSVIKISENDSDDSGSALASADDSGDDSSSPSIADMSDDSLGGMAMYGGWRNSGSDWNHIEYETDPHRKLL